MRNLPSALDPLRSGGVVSDSEPVAASAENRSNSSGGILHSEQAARARLGFLYEPPPPPPSTGGLYLASSAPEQTAILISDSRGRDVQKRFLSDFSVCFRVLSSQYLT